MTGLRLDPNFKQYDNFPLDLDCKIAIQMFSAIKSTTTQTSLQLKINK